MSDKTVDEIVALKKKLENDIATLVYEFTRETGLDIEGVDASTVRVTPLTGGSIPFLAPVKVDVRLP